MNLRSLPAGYSVVMDPEELAEFGEQAARVARLGGVRLMNGRELSAVVLFEGAVAAALWTEACGTCFTFDIAVADDHQRKGLGLALARHGKSLANEYREAGFELELTAISPGGEALAARLGLEVFGRAPGVTLWREPAAAVA